MLGNNKFKLVRHFILKSRGQEVKGRLKVKKAHKAQIFKAP